MQFIKIATDAVISSKKNFLNDKRLVLLIRKHFFHQKFQPRRAVLYVPGDDERKLKKVTDLKVDCVALDCEDGVAINRKNAARETIYGFLEDKTLDKGIADWGVRVNSLSSGLLEEDLRVICSANRPPTTIFLPKVDSTADFDCFSSNLKTFLKNKNHKINLIFYAESCKTVMDLPKVCRHATTTLANSFQLSGIVFGSDDFCASLGATRTEASTEILYARQRIVLIAKAFQLQAIDMVFIDFKNDDGLQAQSLEGAAMGYTGKQIIHPRQIDIVQQAFIPSEEKIQWAIGLLEKFKQHQKIGKGAFVYRNQMIDAPTVKQAENIMHFVSEIKK